jgi:microcin C transport system substrate-binding protein
MRSSVLQRLGCVLLLACPPAWAAHGYALWGDLKYPPGFAHFDYVNAQASKGGELKLVSNLRVSTFDKYNPFTIKGNAPAYLTEMMFETLLQPSLDETASAYCLLASDIEVAPDGLSATFKLRTEARFHNGDAVLAADVKHSYDTLMGQFTSPAYKTLLDDVGGLDVLDDRTVRFRFKKPNRDLPLTVGGIPVFSRKWGLENGKLKSFDKVVTDIPVGSGPYKIGRVNFGKDITYVRDPSYWARDLNVRRGTANFERISIKIYQDNTARLEAFKAGEYDLMQVFSAGDWARRVKGKRFDTGELVKTDFKHSLPSGFHSYVLNTRLEKFKDVRVREALGLAIDYEWMNRQMFYNSYERVQGLFGNTDCHTQGAPSSQELALMEPYRKEIPNAAFGSMLIAPRTDGGSSLRNNLRRARALLKDAGWETRDGVLRNARGEAFELEYLDTREGGVREISPWIRNLEKIGIKLNFRSVDFALYQQRLDKFEFDMVSLAFPGTHNPGQEYSDLFGSKAAGTENSSNFAGVVSPAVDDLISKMAGAKSKPEMVTACHALERVIAHSHYLIPKYTSNTHRVAYSTARLAKPPAMPPYTEAETWVINTWWAK